MARTILASGPALSIYRIKWRRVSELLDLSGMSDSRSSGREMIGSVRRSIEAVTEGLEGSAPAPHLSTHRKASDYQQ